MDKKLVTLMSLFFLSFTLFVSTVFLNSPLSKGLRAAPNIEPSGEKSLMLAWPLELPSDGTTKSTITAFVRDINTNPAPNKTVTLQADSGTISSPTQTTDTEGKTVTFYTCSSPGIAKISAIINNSVAMTQNISIKCK